MGIYNDWFIADYDPELPGDYAPQKGKESAQDVKQTLSKRPKFADQTRPAMLARNENFVRATNPEGKPTLLTKCKSCAQPGEVAEMQLGHETNWKEWVVARSPLCQGAVRAAFNDLKNLGWEHTACNVSHIFEPLTVEETEAFKQGGWNALPPNKRDALYQKAMNSAAFSDDPSVLEQQLSDTASMFLELSTRHKPNDDELITQATQLNLTVNGKQVPIIAPGVPASDGDGDLVLIKNLKRYKWQRETYCALYSIWKNRGWIAAKDGLEYYRCGSCGNWGEGHAMQLGHETDWKQFIKENVGVQSPLGPAVHAAHAALAYADLSNLKYEHQSCNVSHDWESLEDLGLMGPQYNPMDRVNERLGEMKAVMANASNEAHAKLEYSYAKTDIEALLRNLDMYDQAAAEQKVISKADTSPRMAMLFQYLEQYLQQARAQLVIAQQRLQAAETAIGQNKYGQARAELSNAHTSCLAGVEKMKDFEGLSERNFGSREMTAEGRVQENRELISMTAQDFLVTYLGPATLQGFRNAQARAQREENVMQHVNQQPK